MQWMVLWVIVVGTVVLSDSGVGNISFPSIAGLGCAEPLRWVGRTDPPYEISVERMAYGGSTNRPTASGWVLALTRFVDPPESRPDSAETRIAPLAVLRDRERVKIAKSDDRRTQRRRRNAALESCPVFLFPRFPFLAELVNLDC